MSENSIVTQASADELDDIMGVMERAFDPAHGEAWTIAQCRGIMVLPGSFLLIAKQQARVTGFALCRSVLDESELLLFAVDPDLQGGGVGRAILSSVFAECRLRGVSKVHLEMRADNPALRIYTRSGFSRAGVRPNYYRSADGNSADAITLAKNL